MNKKIINGFFLLSIIAAFVLFFGGCASKVTESVPAEPLAILEAKEEIKSEAPVELTDKIDNVDNIEQQQEPPLAVQETQTEITPPDAATLKNEKLYVYFFDVGQADCVLVKAGEHAMLIDAGDTGQDSRILNYLAEHGVKKLDYLAATHPHADHIGSMAAVIRAMDGIGEFLMPDIYHTTATFEHLLDALEEKELEFTVPQSGEKFTMGNAIIQVLAPNSEEYSNLNNYSLVLRVEYGQNVFLFTGDAEDISENEQLSRDFNLRADVLKVGHHGSTTSTTAEYLSAVSPSYAVIFCGKDNSYGHPNTETISRLTDRTVAIYRTDINGTISFVSDGESINVSTEREELPDVSISEPPAYTTPIVQEKTAETPVDSVKSTYIGNKNSKIFHSPSCSTLPAEKNRIYFSARDEALNSNYRPCKKCNP